MAIVESAAAGLHAARAGATVLQLRAPHSTAWELELEAATLVEISPVPVAVSSRVDIALAAGAASVNLPQHDIGVAAARRLLGPGVALGRSVHSQDAARSAESEGADYVIFGPVFATPTHGGRPAVGLEALRAVTAAVSIPVLAIGGVDPNRAKACLDARAAGWAGISAFAPDPNW
jgi:thiamine-phosphate pyrophosphorylase